MRIVEIKCHVPVVPTFIYKTLYYLDEVNKYYKCQEWKYPVANTAVFVKDNDGNFHYKQNSKSDAQIKPLFYASTYTGDSGSGVFRQVEGQGSIGTESKKKNVILASVSLGPKLEEIAENSVRSDVCMFLTSKITEEFITWMKEQDRKYENKGTFEYIH